MAFFLFLCTFRCYQIHDWVTWSAHTQCLITLLQAYLPPASNLPTADCVPACVMLVCRTQLTAPTVRRAHKPRGCSAVLPPPPQVQGGTDTVLASRRRWHRRPNSSILYCYMSEGSPGSPKKVDPGEENSPAVSQAPQTFSFESAALTAELSLPPCVQSSVTAWSLGHVWTVGSGCRALMISVVDVDFLNCRSLWDQSLWGIRKEILGSCFCVFCPVLMKRLVVQE